MREVHFTHAARAERRDHLVVVLTGANSNRYGASSVQVGVIAFKKKNQP